MPKPGPSTSRLLTTMPIRVKSKAQPQRDASPVSTRYDFDLPDIEPEDEFRHVVKKLSLCVTPCPGFIDILRNGRYFTDVVELPSTFEQLRTTSAGESLRTLVDHLSTTCTNPAIVNALLYVLSHLSFHLSNPSQCPQMALHGRTGAPRA